MTHLEELDGIVGKSQEHSMRASLLETVIEQSPLQVSLTMLTSDVVYLMSQGRAQKEDESPSLFPRQF